MNTVAKLIIEVWLIVGLYKLINTAVPEN